VNLTFRFTSDNIVVDKGWIATISCVPLTPAAAITDYAMVSFIAPDVLGKKTNAQTITIRVINNGATTATNVPVFIRSITRLKLLLQLRL
jgi:hypothetical protein